MAEKSGSGVSSITAEPREDQRHAGSNVTPFMEDIKYASGTEKESAPAKEQHERA
jgi:hypothetical protein